MSLLVSAGPELNEAYPVVSQISDIEIPSAVDRERHRLIELGAGGRSVVAGPARLSGSRYC